MRLLPLIAILLTGCSSTKPMKLPWNSRAQEQARHNATIAPEPTTREEELLTHDPNKEFNMATLNTGGYKRYQTKGAHSNEFQFEDRVRSKTYGTGDYATKAWNGNHVYETKEAPTKDSRYAGITADTKNYETKESRDAGKSAEVRALPDGERAFLNTGRRQGDFDTNGPASQIPNQSWEGNLQKMTVEDVRKLLNKN